ncbi:hypothetical protein QJS66_15385 [Kocuria rhizophila]|nr:hypothetical protein QJS66_15385 [Kocuria rhizophila]
MAEVARTGSLPVVMFTAGGVATPADAAMMMQLGADGVFVGSGIFKSGNPAERARAIVAATASTTTPPASRTPPRPRRGHGGHQRGGPSHAAPSRERGGERAPLAAPHDRRRRPPGHRCPPHLGRAGRGGRG